MNSNTFHKFNLHGYQIILALQDGKLLIQACDISVERTLFLEINDLKAQELSQRFVDSSQALFNKIVEASRNIIKGLYLTINKQGSLKYCNENLENGFLLIQIDLKEVKRAILSREGKPLNSTSSALNNPKPKQQKKTSIEFSE